MKTNVSKFAWRALQTYDWRLNERHYGALQGRHKDEAAELMDSTMVHQWRRSWDAIPPCIESDDPYWTLDDERYFGIENLPRAESLKCTWNRILPFWESNLLPEARSGNMPLVVAHGNSLRALLASIEGLNDKEIVDLHIPTATPILYHLNPDTLEPLGPKVRLSV